MFRLGDNWKDVLAKAWSVRGMAATFIFLTLAAMFGVFGAFAGTMRWALVFQVLAALATALSVFARVLVQSNLPGGSGEP